MALYPGDIDSRKIDSRACAIVHYQVDSEMWDYKIPTGHDVGTDCILELSEDGQWRGKKIELQIKGTKHIERYLISNSTIVSYSLKKATIMYGLNLSVPFFLFIVDIEGEHVYFTELHEYFISDMGLFDILEKDTESMNIHIPTKFCLTKRDNRLVEAAKNTYVNGATRNLKVAQ